MLHKQLQFSIKVWVLNIFVAATMKYYDRTTICWYYETFIGSHVAWSSHEAGVEYNKNARGLYCVLCTLTLDVITATIVLGSQRLAKNFDKFSISLVWQLLPDASMADSGFTLRWGTKGRAQTPDVAAFKKNCMSKRQPAPPLDSPMKPNKSNKILENVYQAKGVFFV